MNLYNLLYISNVDLLILGITNTAILLLGIVVFLNNRKSITNKTFLLVSISATLYGITNHINYQLDSPQLVLWAIRIVIFFAVWYSFFLFQLFYVFPKNELKFSKTYRTILIPLVIFTSFLTLTPFIFPRLAVFAPSGQVSTPATGPGVILFAPLIIYLVGIGMFLLFRKTVKAVGIERRQLQFVFTGALITYTFIIIFNLIFPIVLKNTFLVSLAPIFTLPFILFTAYAILRYGLLNIKVIATEILTFILAIVTLVEVLFAQDLKILIFRIILFAAVLGFGILLIRSVQKEVRQREQLQRLTDDLARANAELKRLDKAKSEFVSIASHQLRTPLTAIKGYISLMLEEAYGKLDEKIRDPISKVYESNERLIRLVNDLLSISRIESGKMKLELGETDILDLIKSVVDELGIKANEKKLKLIVQRPKTLLSLLNIDKEKVRNVLLNIVDNAIRYTDKGSVTIKIEQVVDNVRITVSDTGAGMTEEVIGNLFESFSRGQAGMQRWTEGAGLGLYIAKKFIEMHKGRIWAESEGKGQGSTFFVELPRK